MIKNRLQEKRKNWHGKGLTLAQLANRIELSRSYICKIEQNRREPSSKVMFRLAKFFKCGVEEMFFDDSNNG